MPRNAPEPIAFEAATPWPQPKADTLVIQCSDHRFQAQFDDFLWNGLGLQSFDRLVVPGGPQFLMAAAALPKFEWAGRRWLKFLVKHHGLRRLILVAHDDCGWYKDISVGSIAIPLLRERQIADLRKTPQMVHELVPNVECRLFFAKPNDAGRVQFIEIK
ncbi:MAG TPA: carbonic anhydrase [Planctomycetota bacterium]|nr:carbonic anhydrase [Planctomycetota bacterium]